MKEVEVEVSASDASSTLSLSDTMWCMQQYDVRTMLKFITDDIYKQMEPDAPHGLLQDLVKRYITAIDMRVDDHFATIEEAKQAALQVEAVE